MAIGDVRVDDGTGEFFLEDETATDVIGPFDPGPIYKPLYAIWAEENGGLGAGLNEYSFGNGAAAASTGADGRRGVPLLFDSRLVGISVGARIAGTGTTSIAVVNQVTGGTLGSISLAANTASGNLNQSTQTASRRQRTNLTSRDI